MPRDIAEAAKARSGDEDVFDYPAPSASSAWSVDEAPSTVAATADSPPSKAPARGRVRGWSGAREAGAWRQVAARRRHALMVAAALVVVGGFGLALSMVSDTVSTNPASGGTARVPAPKSPQLPWHRCASLSPCGCC